MSGLSSHFKKEMSNHPSTFELLHFSTKLLFFQVNLPSFENYFLRNNSASSKEVGE
jgi:hypothetical protein